MKFAGLIGWLTMSHRNRLPQLNGNKETVMTASVLSTLPLPLFIRGKVRDVYDLGDHLLMVASDRISAFDYVLPTPVPDKGKILTQISAWWFALTTDLVPNHLISSDVEQFPSSLSAYRDQLPGRTMLVRK